MNHPTISQKKYTNTVVPKHSVMSSAWHLSVVKHPCGVFNVLQTQKTVVCWNTVRTLEGEFICMYASLSPWMSVMQRLAGQGGSIFAQRPWTEMTFAG